MENEWDQRRADSRSVVVMGRIAQDAMQLDDSGFQPYADEHDLTVDEVVYYLNAYEYGGEAGLQAIRNPDIIPSGVARRAIRTIEATLVAHFEGRVPCRVIDEGTAIGVYQIQKRMNGEEYLFAICQFRLTLSTNRWHLYWMRKFDAWWPYSPPEAGRKHTLRARLQQVLDDEFGCYWG